MIKSLQNNLKEGFIAYGVIFKYWVLFLLIGLTARTLLSFLFMEPISSELLYILLYGLRMDTIVFSALGIIFSLLYTFNLLLLLQVALTLSTLAYFIIEIVTFGFLDKFYARPNYLFLEHLGNYPEVFGMIWELYTVPLIVLLPILLYTIYRVDLYFKQTLYKSSIKAKLMVLPFILILLMLGGRSSLDSSTPNQGFYTFSRQGINNELANNSIFSILYANYLLKKEKFYNYGDLSFKDALANVKRLNHINNETEGLHRLQKSLFNKKKNIILVILESFGHEHVGYLGGTPTTPNLDRLTKESLYFTNLYATGTRTSWGISALTTSLYPIPSREYVKASKSQKDFYTTAKTLKNHGYESTFLYSGDVDFDNMRGFLLANGYDNVYGKESFSKEKNRYTWGYSDEDLYNKALFLAKNSKKKPFFLTLLTLSSHEPFDYPKNRVAPYSKAPIEGFANSIKYADYAIGQFMKQLKQEGLLENTVVAFIADHNNDAYGAFDVPIDRYKIPAII
ncbi:MAG TPA: alkaline phosphatase family protein, partial [Campylobacterales bacterium]|nr:alkaline phosphatase family protein [Campylobacterales bacterium]